MKFASHYARLSTDHAQTLSKLDGLLYAREGSEEAMLELVDRNGFQAVGSSSADEENCLLDAVVDQLNRLRKVTDVEELRHEAATYLERCPRLADDTPLQTFVPDEQWSDYLNEMRANRHHCDHVVLTAVATVLRRTVVLYSGAEPNREPIAIIPDDVDGRFRPIHVGHVSGLTFVTLRPKSGVQPQDDDEMELQQQTDDDVIFQEDEDEEADDTDAESPSAVQHSPAGEASRWNVRNTCSRIFTGTLQWQPAGIKFTQCVSVKNQHFRPCRNKKLS